MMQVKFVRWCLDPAGRTEVSVAPDAVECAEHFCASFKGGTGETLPDATRIIMRKGREYIVQGALAGVTDALNAAAKASRTVSFDD